MSAHTSTPRIGIGAGLAWLMIQVLRAYQLLISPLYGPTCRYYPSCSNYAVQALRIHGPIRGLWLIAWRLARCNPWTRGGVDDVPPARQASSHHH